MADRYYLDNEERLWEESDVDDGVQLVHLLGPRGGDVLPLTTVEEFHGPLTTLAQYDHEVLVEVLVYHTRNDIKGCRCGWAELGRSWPEHVVTVYEESVLARSGG